jgi:hypothetical protein
MRGSLLEAETLETLRVAQHLAPLLGQGGEWIGELLLGFHTYLKHLLGFLPSGNAAEGRQAKRNAMRILRLTHPMSLGHPEQRFDRIGADRQADMIEPERRGGLQLEVKLGSQLLTQSGRGHGVNQRLALTPGVVREPLRLENFLALQQAVGIGSKPLDEGFARGQLIETSPQLG